MIDRPPTCPPAAWKLSLECSEDWKRLRLCMLRYARRCSPGDEHAAEDLVQFALTQALCALPPHIRSVTAWLQAVMRNQARRSWGDHARWQAEDWAPQAETLETCCPQQLARKAEHDDKVLKLLETLSPKYREPLELRYLGGWSIPEIAHALGVRDANVRQRLKRGLRQLRARPLGALGDASSRSRRDTTIQDHKS